MYRFEVLKPPLLMIPRAPAGRLLHVPLVALHLALLELEFCMDASVGKCCLHCQPSELVLVRETLAYCQASGLATHCASRWAPMCPMFQWPECLGSLGNADFCTFGAVCRKPSISCRLGIFQTKVLQECFSALGSLRPNYYCLFMEWFHFQTDWGAHLISAGLGMQQVCWAVLGEHV